MRHSFLAGLRLLVPLEKRSSLVQAGASAIGVMRFEAESVDCAAKQFADQRR